MTDLRDEQVGHCAHLTVNYDPEMLSGGRLRDRWRCKDCGHEFISKSLAEHFQQTAEGLRKALEEIIEGDCDCACNHNTEDCCYHRGEYCPRCIAAAALAQPRTEGTQDVYTPLDITYREADASAFKPQVCGICGGWIIDQLAHTGWHNNIGDATRYAKYTGLRAEIEAGGK